MAQARKVLLADPDMNSLRALTKALRTRGYQVQYAPDGARALEVAVLRHPDVVLFDERCTLIEARAFVQILATNPRTDDVPVVITSATRSHDRAQGLREGVLQKPFNLDEVLSRIDHLCRRSEAARALRGGAREIEGGLGQLPLVDLLQILSMNRRTGRLVLTLGSERGEVQLAAGRPVNARLGDIEAEKALFRLLGWLEGTFAFHPGEAPTRTRIDRSMEDVLLEGMRQVDERARLLANLPPLTQVLALAPDSAAPIEPHPVMREVLRVIGQPRRLQEVLDLADAPDLEVLGSLSTLLEKGVVQAIESTGASVDALLGAAEVHALRGRLLRGKPARNALVAKLLVCATGPRGARWFLHHAPGLVQAASDPSCLRSSFGTLARLEVSEVLKLDFVVVPTAPAARPLWRPFVTGALGALMLEGGDPVLRLARFCAFDLRLPVVLATGEASGGLLASGGVPTSLRGAPGGVISVESTVGAAIRSLLLMALQTPQGAMPEAGPLWPGVATQS